MVPLRSLDAWKQPFNSLIPCYPRWLVKLFPMLGCKYLATQTMLGTHFPLVRSTSVGCACVCFIHKVPASVRVPGGVWFLCCERCVSLFSLAFLASPVNILWSLATVNSFHSAPRVIPSNVHLHSADVSFMSHVTRSWITDAARVFTVLHTQI